MPPSISHDVPPLEDVAVKNIPAAVETRCRGLPVGSMYLHLSSRPVGGLSRNPSCGR
jgi:hypothetical protein